MLWLLPLAPAVAWGPGDLPAAASPRCLSLHSPLRPSRRHFPRVMPLSKPGTPGLSCVHPWGSEGLVLP